MIDKCEVQENFDDFGDTYIETELLIYSAETAVC